MQHVLPTAPPAPLARLRCQRALDTRVWVATAALVALGIGQLIGGDRPGPPYDAMANVHAFVDKTTDFSFPSDHAPSPPSSRC